MRKYIKQSSAYGLDFIEEVAELIEIELDRLGISYSELGKRAGVSHTVIGSILRRNHCCIESVIAILKYLGYKLEVVNNA